MYTMHYVAITLLLQLQLPYYVSDLLAIACKYVNDSLPLIIHHIYIVGFATINLYSLYLGPKQSTGAHSANSTSYERTH